MTEPVAYMWKTVRGTIVGLTLADDKNPHVGNATPLYTAEQLHPRVKMTQTEFDLLKEINRGIRGFEQLEEHIEVESNMKWFVRRILPNAGGNMLYYTDEGVLTYNNNKEHATKFDTKEEAEKWTNPLTEAVQLPVEEK